MRIEEVRDPDLARRRLLDGLLMARTGPLDAATIHRALSWSLEIAGSGEPLPPVGFIADVGRVALGREHAFGRREPLPLAKGFEPCLARRYDDYVLGKLYADPTFERGSDALMRYQGRDRDRGLAYLIGQFRQRAGFGGVVLSPAVIKSLLQEPVETLLPIAWTVVVQEGVAPPLLDAYEELIVAFQNLGEVLGTEDVFELEHGLALAQSAQRLALRQVIGAAEELNRGLPLHKPGSLVGRRQVATNLLDEDVYPMGGFSEISNRGSIESLLHSQLAYMEHDERPDLFDLKFLRDELLYYARDENQFLRRRQTFVFALYPDLAQARFKDAASPWQRIILVLAMLVATVRRLTDWLSNESLTFEFLLLDARQLATEEELLRILFREQIAAGVVTVSHAEANGVAPFCKVRVRRSVCHVLAVSMVLRRLEVDSATVAALALNSTIPEIVINREALPPPESDDPVEAWREQMVRLLREWIG